MKKNISFQNDILPLKDMLFRLALRITLNREEAEDVVQDTLIKVWKQRDRWDEIDSMEAFSTTICRNLSLDRIKRKSTDNESLDDMTPAHEPATASNPYETTQQRDRLQLVGHIIDSLPEKQRSCVQLRDIEGKSYKEIADILQVSEDQVKVNIFRARQTIRQQFNKYDQYGL